MQRRYKRNRRPRRDDRSDYFSDLQRQSRNSVGSLYTLASNRRRPRHKSNRKGGEN